MICWIWVTSEVQSQQFGTYFNIAGTLRTWAISWVCFCFNDSLACFIFATTMNYRDKYFVLLHSKIHSVVWIALHNSICSFLFFLFINSQLPFLRIYIQSCKFFGVILSSSKEFLAKTWRYHWRECFERLVVLECWGCQRNVVSVITHLIRVSCWKEKRPKATWNHFKFNSTVQG